MTTQQVDCSMGVSIKSQFVVGAVRCYQCSSDADPKGEDNCGAYRTFDKTHHIAIECNSEESHMPGSFCMKLTQQSPKGFICMCWSWSYFFLLMWRCRGWAVEAGHQEVCFSCWYRSDRGLQLGGVWKWGLLGGVLLFRRWVQQFHQT